MITPALKKSRAHIMARSLEDIVGKITRERVLPRERPGEEGVRFVGFENTQKAGELFRTVVWGAKPSIAKNGGVVLDGFIVHLPDGTPFYTLTYHGDIAGWQNQIERGAAALGLLIAKIESDVFVVSDGRSYPLSECTVERHRALI